MAADDVTGQDELRYELDDDREERPDLAETKARLIQQQNAFTIKITNLEDAILKKLANAEGDITEDVELIEGLEDSKRIAAYIEEKSEIAKKTQENISLVSEKYRSATATTTMLSPYNYIYSKIYIPFPCGGHCHSGSLSWVSTHHMQSMWLTCVTDVRTL